MLFQSLNPRFDQTFAFKMPRHPSCRVDTLEVEVFDWNPVTKDTSLGKATLDLCSVFADGWHVTVREQYPLQPCVDDSPLTTGSGRIKRTSSPTKADDRGGPGEVGLRFNFLPDLPFAPGGEPLGSVPGH